MKGKVLSLLLGAAIVIITLSGCTKSNQNTASGSNNETKKLSIVCTIFPEYDWVKQILGEQQENADVTLLLKNGVDLHSFQPTAQDIVKISDADLFLYVGGTSDAWVDDVLKSTKNPNRVVLNLMDLLENEIKEEELVEGMQAEEHDHDEQETHDQEEIEYDEHVWLSLSNAKLVCQKITETIKQLDTEHADMYQTNCDSYIKDLQGLDDDYSKMVQTAKRDTILCGDRFPFRYLMDEYGLKYYAAFVGCSAETEASFETITFLAQKVDELELPVVFTIENSDQKLANTIIANTKNKNQEIQVLDSMQSVTTEDINAGENYLAIMQKNYEALNKALN